MIRFVVKRSARFWLLAVTSFAQAGPLPVAAVRNEHEPAASRRYEVREDSRTGRLVRVAVSARLSGKRKAAPGSVKTGDAAPGNRVVQGRSARGSQFGSGARVDIDALVRAAAGRHSVDARFVHEVIRQESNYDLFAVSSKGACGLMQLMPETAKRFGVQDIFDPAENVEGGVKYLRHLMDRYDGDSLLTLAAYNAGEGAVDSHGGVPPYRETQDYVRRITDRYGILGSSVSDGTGAAIGRVVARQMPSGLLVFEME